jgi:hypothetical protein
VTTLPTYSFLPYLRQGIANTITSADGDQTIQARATTHVALQLTGDPIGSGAELTQALVQDIALYGPGDVVGIDTRAVVRIEPRDWITNFESNHLAAVDFYDEDFPWRYTPAAPDAGHLRVRPWISLIVLADGEFDEAQDLSGRPLPYVSVHSTNLLPPAAELWAWAHVHFNQTLAADASEIVSTDTAAVIARAESILAANRDNAYARLMSPRRLTENTTYHALVVPTFETGRLAGLGHDPTDAPFATASAWASYSGKPDDGKYPYYYRWRFKTGSYGDFEYLVRLLVPQPVDPRVGTRDLDVQDPGSNLPPINSGLGGILRLGGALQVPDADLTDQQKQDRAKYENWDQPYPNTFEKALAAFIDLPDDYQAQTAAAANAASGLGIGVTDDPDPLITAPLYGRWHALTQRLLTERDSTPAPNPENWVHRLNLDPRFRVPAGFGADVVETNAEEYMNDAWQQIGDVLAANARIRGLHLGVAVSSRWFDRHLTPLSTVQRERAFGITAPLHQRIIESGMTVAATRASSLVSPALTATAMRRTLRPGGRLMRLLPFAGGVTPGNLLARVNAGEVNVAPPKTPPAGVVTVGQVAGAAQPPDVPGPIASLLARFPWLPWALIRLGIVLLVVLAIVLPLGIGLLIGAVILAALIALAVRLLRYERKETPPLSIEEGDQKPGEVASFPHNPGFTLTVPGSGQKTPVGASDSAVAVRFKQALGDSFALIDASTTVGRTRTPATLNLAQLSGNVLAAIDPTVTIPRRGFSTINLPAWITGELLDQFGEVMTYPNIDLPMYQPLKDISIELFLPNINLIAENSITLVETNQRFIEAYMVGLNHEFARKLLWREYPTDQRGSYFRQFWDVKSVINSEGLSESAFKEQLYDIPELHRWALTSALGQHNNRQPSGQTGEQAVLVIRGELLKKYPTAIIYANRAEWEFEADGVTPDLTKPRKLVPLTDAEEQAPPPSKLRFPLYEAKADPDIYFFGFDLTVDEARGGSGHPPDDDPGWFFVIKERPGEPRFGLELSRGPDVEVLDEVTWNDALGAPPPPGGPPQFLSAGSLDPVALSAPPAGDPEGKQPQYDDDVKADSAAVSAARWAYLLFRPPVMVAVHADQMLRNP